MGVGGVLFCGVFLFGFLRIQNSGSKLVVRGVNEDKQLVTMICCGKNCGDYFFILSIVKIKPCDLKKKKYK